MQELSVVEVSEVSGGVEAISKESAAYAIISLGLCGGPFTAALGITIGVGMLIWA